MVYICNTVVVMFEWNVYSLTWYASADISSFKHEMIFSYELFNDKQFIGKTVELKNFKIIQVYNL